MSSSEKKPQARETRFLSIAGHVPDRVLTNADLERIVDTSDEWIVTRTGIRERRMVEPSMAASDLAEVASRQALERAGISADQLDLILVGTVTGDHAFPSTSCILQARLGATNAICMDVGAACSGFLYASEVARAFIGTGQARHVLIVGVEILTKFVNFEERSTCVLFGDGAGAAVLGPGDESHRIVASHLGCDGRQAELIKLQAGGSREPFSADTLERKTQFLSMQGNEVFKTGVRQMADACFRVLEKAGVAPTEVDLFVPHQANMRIIDALSKRLELPVEKVFVNIEKYGNTSAASVPIAVDEAVRSGRVREGDLLLMVVFGSGFTWGASLVRW